ncbi:MAG: DinB family protein [Bryobacteraceae bacterium]|nr:DinB family protein [Bryobacteraceae bacterium]
MTESEFPGILQLRATPGILRSLTAALTGDEAAWKPASGRWSVLEALGHLRHVELGGFRGRLERIFAEDNPTLPPYDPDEFAAAGLYGGRTLASALDEFEAERARSLAFLETVPAERINRSAAHGELGPITASNLLHEWPLHDLGHVRQVAELVRAVKYYPHIGAWQKFYTLNP